MAIGESWNREPRLHDSATSKLSCHYFVAARRDTQGEVPEHLCEWRPQDLNSAWSLPSAAWWKRHWENTGIIDINAAESMTDGWREWLRWHKIIAPNNVPEINALESDRGRYLGWVRLVGQRRSDAKLLDKIASLPAMYTKKPLLLSE